MVEYTFTLDSVFGALADRTRRDILSRVSRQRLSISEIAKDYDLTFAAISKHLKVLEKAQLIIKRRHGKQQVVELAPQTLANIDEFLKSYRKLWEGHMDALDNYLKESKES